MNNEQQYEAEVQRIKAIIRTAKLAGIPVHFELPQKPYEIRPQHVKELQSITPEQILGVQSNEVATPDGPKLAQNQTNQPKIKQAEHNKPIKTRPARTSKPKKQAREFVSNIPRPSSTGQPPRRQDVVYGNLLDQIQIFGGGRSDTLRKILGEYTDKYGYANISAGLTRMLDQDPGLLQALTNLTNYRDFADAGTAGRAFDAFGWMLREVGKDPDIDLRNQDEFYEKWASFEEFREPT